MERSLISKNLNNEEIVNDFIFDSFISDLNFIKDDMIMLKALLSYKSIKMIRLNELRATAAIDLAIDSLKALRKSIEEI